MYRVMIVDDEKYIRKSIIRRVDWEKYNLLVVGEASNGEEAYHRISILKPDLIMADIRMPKLDGLELANLLAEEYPNIRVIIISAYSDFTYAKQAIKAGVFDYLLKPLDEMELDKTLSRLLLEMKEEKAEEKVPVIEINGLTQHIREGHKYGGVALFTGNILDGSMSWYGSLDKNYLETVLNGKIYWVIGHPAVGCQILFVCAPDLNEGKLIKISKTIVDYGNKKRAKDEIPSIGLSMIHTSIQGEDNVISCIEQAVLSLKRKLFYPDKKLFEWMKTNSNNQEEIKSYLELSVLYNQIFKTEYGKAENLLIKEIEAFDWNGIQHTDPLESMIEEVISVLRKAGRQADCYCDFKVATHELCRIDFLLYYNNTQEVHQVLIQIVHQVFDAINKLSGQDMIRNIKCYIGANLSGNLQIEALAQHFFMNPTYMSALFKEKTHMTLSGYIESVRMEKAKELIKSGLCNVADTALAVGYGDSNYFCKVFKKYTNITPSKYRIQ